jgi:hypothetical protein
MKPLVTVCALGVALALCRTVHAQEQVDVEPLASPVETIERPAPPARPAEDRPTPRLALSYERLSAGNVDGSAMALQALHLDMYALSWRWLRAGVEADAGRGHTVLSGAAASIKYGLIGMNAGIQLPGRVTPFFEGRLDGGVLGGTLDGSVTIPGTTISASGVSAATWMVAYGLDAGMDVYALGRGYISLSLGWLRTTWGGADYDAMLAEAGTSVKLRDVTHDSFLFKIGIGI